MNDCNDISKEKITTLGKAAGLSLSPLRAELLIPAAVRLQRTARWLSKHDLGLTEPAFLFDSQAKDEFCECK